MFLVSGVNINNILNRRMLNQYYFSQIDMIKNDFVALAIFQLFYSVKFSKL